MYHVLILSLQPAIVPLHKLIVREKAGEDNVLFLISASNYQAEMYELIFQSQSDSKLWMQAIRKATDNCPEEGNYPLKPFGFVVSSMLVIIKYCNIIYIISFF